MALSPALGPAAPASAAAPTLTVGAVAVPLGGFLDLRGNAPRGRVVTLQLLRAGKWMDIAATQASSAGTFHFSAPTSWLGTRRVRVWTPSGFLSPGGYSSYATYQVLPPYRPVGRRTSFALAFPGFRWDPCQVIGWKFNANGGDGRLLYDVAAAFRELGAATGLQFAYQGATTRVGLRDTASRAGTDILVSWATPREVAALAGRTVGVTSTKTSYIGREYVGASVALDRTARLRFGSRAGGRPTWEQTALHERGHALGLAHSADRQQVLYRRLSARNHRLGAGDLAGLQLLGADNPCVDRD
jgi:hypothetical protein